MHTSAHPRFRASNPISVVRVALLALALVAANATLQLAKASDFTVPLDSAWTFNAHTEYPGSTGSLEHSADGKSLKISFDFTGGGSFVSTGRTIDDKSTFSGLEITAKGAGGLGVSIVDSTGQNFVYQIGPPGDGTKPITVSFDHPSNSFGGAKDKVVHYPVTSLSITISKSPDAMSGVIEVSSIVLKAAPTP